MSLGEHDSFGGLSEGLVIVSNPSLIKRSALVTVIYMASAIFGLLRVLVLAVYFGASPEADAFVVAVIVPSLVFDFVIDGTLGSAFVPVAARVERAGGIERSGAFAGAFLILVVGFAAVTSVLVVVASGPLAHLLAPGFAEEGARLVAHLISLMTPAVFMAVSTGAIMAVLFARERVVLSTANTLMFNIVVIVSAVALVPLLGVTAMAWGHVAAAAVQLLAQALMLWAVRREAVRRPRWELAFGPDMREVGVLLLPLLGMLLVGYASRAVNGMVASGLGMGSVAALNYAARLVRLPAGVFTMAVSLVVFPRMARATAKAQTLESAKVVSNAFLYALLVGLPGTVLLTVLAYPVVELLFRRGAFTETDVVLTARVLTGYSLAAFGYSVSEIMQRSSFALANTRSPLLFHSVVSVAQVPAVILLARVWGTPGIAFGTALAACANAALLCASVFRRLPVDLRYLFFAGAKMVVASGACGLATWVSVTLLGGPRAWTSLSAVVPVGVGSITGVAAFGLTLVALWPSIIHQVRVAAQGVVREHPL